MSPQYVVLESRCVDTNTFCLGLKTGDKSGWRWAAAVALAAGERLRYQLQITNRRFSLGTFSDSPLVRKSGRVPL